MCKYMRLLMNLQNVQTKETIKMLFLLLWKAKYRLHNNVVATPLHQELMCPIPPLQLNQVKALNCLTQVLTCQLCPTHQCPTVGETILPFLQGLGEVQLHF